MLFLLYTADLIWLIEGRGLHLHLYTDDTQVYGFCRPQEFQAIMDRMVASVSNVASWMMSNRLQFNAAKTEALWCVSCQQHLIPSAPLRDCADDIKPGKYVRDLGIYIDMKTHVSWTVSSCYASLRHICSIRRSISKPILLSLVTAMVLSSRLRQHHTQRHHKASDGSSAVSAQRSRKTGV